MRISAVRNVWRSVMLLADENMGFLTVCADKIYVASVLSTISISDVQSEY